MAATRWEVENGWLYSEKAVAKVQRFFGLECLDNSGDGVEQETTNNSSSCETNGSLTQNNGTQKPSGTANTSNGARLGGRDGATSEVPPSYKLRSRSKVNGVSTDNSTGQTSSCAEIHDTDLPSNLHHVHRKTYLGDPNASLQTPVEYRVHNKFWYHLFAFGAALGDDVFYFTVYPFWFFNISPWVIRRVVLMWGIIMYVGQSSKEIFKMPRPSSPPVAPLEKRYFQEYGMPSTHAMVGTLIPFTVLYVTMGKVEYPPVLGFVLACSYTLLVCMSRLYKGMHFIMDIIVGTIATFVLMFIVLQFLDALDEFLITHPYAPLVSVATAILLALVYPTQDGWSSTRGDTIVIMGVTTGIYCSLWVCHLMGIPPGFEELPPPHITWPGPYDLLLMAVREVIGVSLMGISYFLFRTLILTFLALISGQEINAETKRKTWVEIPYKYITYFAVCVASNFFSPVLFKMIGL